MTEDQETPNPPAEETETTRAPRGRRGPMTEADHADPANIPSASEEAVAESAAEGQTEAAPIREELQPDEAGTVPVQRSGGGADNRVPADQTSQEPPAE